MARCVAESFDASYFGATANEIRKTPYLAICRFAAEGINILANECNFTNPSINEPADFCDDVVDVTRNFSSTSIGDNAK
jgi:hypothetical protein